MAKTEKTAKKDKKAKVKSLKEVRKAAEQEAEDSLSGDDKQTEREIPIGDGDTLEDSSEDVATDPVLELESKVSALEEEKLRVMADLDNYRKRMNRQFQDVVKSANDSLLMDMLEVIDNFERAMSITIDNGAVDCKELAAFREGTVLIYQQMQGLLESYKVREIESVGQTFDPNYHEAMMQVASDEYDEGIIAAVITKGYMVDDRVLRHARVSVSRGPSQESEDSD